MAPLALYRISDIANRKELRLHTLCITFPFLKLVVTARSGCFVIQLVPVRKKSTL